MNYLIIKERMNRSQVIDGVYTNVTLEEAIKIAIFDFPPENVGWRKRTSKNGTVTLTKYFKHRKTFPNPAKKWHLTRRFILKPVEIVNTDGLKKLINE